MSLKENTFWKCVNIIDLLMPSTNLTIVVLLKSQPLKDSQLHKKFLKNLPRNGKIGI